MEFLVGLFIFGIALYISGAILQVVAKKQLDFHLLGASVDDAVDVLTTSGVLRGGWKEANGPGQINIRPGFLIGGRKNRPVISMDLESDSEGTHVQIWFSAWISTLGVVEPWQSVLVIMRRKKIVNALHAVCQTNV